ncbi:LytTR family transcriptional regulator DNA-binding domain-containing protein [Ornithinibacillus massiliensis]|uniref:LytTR family transcriptional regulator DNA-binding domain-containing protein n=1 Tax=Ornithinibacillus massiliensis TaxID=1944633 RepID=A0ABS5MGY8_9BACI|nr:LytTR family transcriptional regulator DNA-binding domain-containing protein [Ornithinibacillus massiliensis]MBS3681410.1 LytTR family transcriptional regulator DNA-binding domain-containing protein [Ornithinibacillus massiliensis]
MSVLAIHNLEKQEKDMLLFPAFELGIEKGQVVVIHSNLNIRVAILEMLAGKEPIFKGEITLLGEKIYKKKKETELKLGICFFEVGLYPRLTVLDHINFYKQLYGSELSNETILDVVQLGVVKNKKINQLTFSEKRRVHFALILIQDPIAYIFEEPDLNVDMETKRVFLNILEELKEKDKAILVLTNNMESAITMSNDVYRLGQSGLSKVQMEDGSEAKDKEEGQVALNFNKIPTKVNEKIILFDPPEIDYIESNDGQSIVFIKGESFPSVFTLNELEQRLKPFGFFRCHRSYIVNLQKVREVITWTRNSYSLVLDDKPKSSIPLSKAKMALLNEMLGLK